MAGAGRDAADSVAPAAPPPSPMASRVTNEGMRLEMQAERKKMAERQVAAKGESAAISPCERARALAGRKRFREAEDEQRACLSGELSEPAREKGLVFLAELLDRQERFVDADAVIAEVDRRFPQSRPLDSYRQQRPMVQKLRK